MVNKKFYNTTWKHQIFFLQNKMVRLKMTLTERQENRDILLSEFTIIFKQVDLDKHQNYASFHEFGKT